GVVDQLRVGGADPIDFLHLAGTELFVRIEAPQALQQSLAAQDFVTAADHAVEVVGDVEDRRVAVGHGRVEREQIGRDGAAFDRRVNAVEQVHRGLDPYTPVPKEAALDADGRGAPVRPDGERRDQIEN